MASASSAGLGGAGSAASSISRTATDDFDKVIAQPYMRGVLAELVDQSDDHQARLPRLGRPGLRPGADRAALPVRRRRRDRCRHGRSTRPRLWQRCRAHGWHVIPGGQTTCHEPGTAADECGAGIPAGTPIKFVWANVSSSISPVGAARVADIRRRGQARRRHRCQLRDRVVQLPDRRVQRPEPSRQPVRR